jgi:hypothetical protein
MGQVGGHIANPSASFTRPADTTAYASGDLVANSTTAGSVAPMEFTILRQEMGRRAGNSAMIRRAFVRKSGTGVTNASFRLHLYGSSPTAANGDNAAWSTSQAATWLGAIDVVVDRAFSDGAAGVSAQVEIGRVLGGTGSVIYGLLEARGAYTPGNAEVFTVELEVIQD